MIGWSSAIRMRRIRLFGAIWLLAADISQK
jgi:hypothetical protein